MSILERVVSKPRGLCPLQGYFDLVKLIGPSEGAGNVAVFCRFPLCFTCWRTQNVKRLLENRNKPPLNLVASGDPMASGTRLRY